MDKINFREMLANHMSGNSEDVDFCIKFAEDHQAKGDIPDQEIMKELFVHLGQQSNHEKSRKVIALNTKAAEAIDGLTNMECWPQLMGVSKHALEANIEVLEGMKDKPWHKLLVGEKIRLRVLNEGMDNFKNVFTPEFLEKMDFKSYLEGKK